MHGEDNNSYHSVFLTVQELQDTRLNLQITVLKLDIGNILKFWNSLQMMLQRAGAVMQMYWGCMSVVVKEKGKHFRKSLNCWLTEAEEFEYGRIALLSKASPFDSCRMEGAQVFDLSQYISSFVSAQEQNILEFYFVIIQHLLLNLKLWSRNISGSLAIAIFQQNGLLLHDF